MIRFSVRTLLVIMTVVSVWFGSLVNKAKRQERAVALIHSLGGRVMYDYQFDADYVLIDHEGIGGEDPAPEPSAPQWLRNLLGDHYFCDVIEISFWNSPRVTDDVVATVSHLPKLRAVCICKCPVTDNVVKQLARTASSIKKLVLRQTECSDTALQHIKHFKQLTRLDLGCTQVTDACVADLAELKNLESLLIDGTRISNAGLALIQGTMPKTSVSTEAWP